MCVLSVCRRTRCVVAMSVCSRSTELFVYQGVEIVPHRFSSAESKAISTAEH